MRRAAAAPRRSSCGATCRARTRAAARVGDRVRRLHARERRDARRPREPPLARARRSPIEQFTAAPPSPEQIAYAEMPAGSAVVYLGRHDPRRRCQLDRRPAPRRAPELLPRVAAHRGEQLPVDAAGGRGAAAAPRAGAARVRGARRHPARWRLPRHGAHAGPGRAARTPRPF